MSGQPIHLRVAHPAADDLRSCAKAVMRALGGVLLEERDSVNHIDGHYFLGQVGGVAVKLMLPDLDDHVDLPFWIILAPDPPTRQDLDRKVCGLINRCLRADGFQMARLLRPGSDREIRVPL